eukprot:GHVR01038789.1.p1 GENE.GHVR01038789.1~~GHVR01038789.1.p1  ORF type:complete len:198 (-),score=23.07 GHVR01038789.1:185-778(-)
MYSITLGVMPFTQGDNKYSTVENLQNGDDRLRNMTKKFSHITPGMYENFQTNCTFEQLEKLFIEIKLTYKDNKTKKEIKLKTPIINNTRYNLNKFVTPWNIKFTEAKLTNETFIIGSGILQDNLMNKTEEIRGNNKITKGDIFYYKRYYSDAMFILKGKLSELFKIYIASEQEQSPKQSSHEQLQASLNIKTVSTNM